MNKITGTTTIRPSQIIIAIISAIMITTALVALAPSVGATGRTNDNAATGVFGAADQPQADNIPILKFTITDGGDTVIKGTAPAVGATLTGFTNNFEMFVDNDANGSFEENDAILNVTALLDVGPQQDWHDNEIRNFDAENVFINSDNNDDNYDTGDVIIQIDEDGILENSAGNNDNVIRSGSAGLVSVKGTNLAYYEADSASSNFDSENEKDYIYYDNDGDLVVDAGELRMGSPTVTAGSDSAMNIELGLENFYRIVSSDNDVGWSLSGVPSYNIYYENKGDNQVTIGDNWAIDIDGNGQIKDNDILLYGDLTNAAAGENTKLTNVLWKIGEVGGTTCLAFDVPPGGPSDNDLVIYDGAAEYNGNWTYKTNRVEDEKVMYYDVDGSSGLSDNDAVYADVDEDDTVSVGDFRLRTFATQTLSSAIVGANDLDVGVKLTSFEDVDNVYYTDNNYDENYWAGSTSMTREAIIESSDSTLDPFGPTNPDNILYEGAADFDSFTANIEMFIDNVNPTSNAFDNGEDIVKITEVTQGTDGLYDYAGDNIRNFASGKKYAGTGAYSDGDNIVNDVDSNGIFQDQFTEIQAKNTAPEPKLESGQIAAVRLWRDNGDGSFSASADNLVSENVEWLTSKKFKIQSFTENIDGNTTYFVTVSAASGITHWYGMRAQVTSLKLGGGNLTGFTNANRQHVTAKPFDADDYAIGDDATITIYDPAQNSFSDAKETLDISISTTSGDSVTLTIEETGNDTGVFQGTLALRTNSGGDNLLVEDNDTISLTYDGDNTVDYAAIDNNAPVLSNLGAENMVESKFVKPDNRIIKVDIEENEGWTAKFYVDDSNFENDSGSGYGTASVIWEASAKTDNSYEFKAVVTDDYGRSTEITKTLVVDNTEPEVSNLSASPSVIDNESPVDITFSVDANDDNLVDSIEGSGVSLVEVDVGPLQGISDNWLSLTEADGTWTGTLAGGDITVTTENTYYLTVRAKDNMVTAGYSANTNTDENIAIEMVEDDTAPILENVVVTYPTGQEEEVKAGQSVTVSVDTVDETADILSVEVNAENLGEGTLTMVNTSGNTYENTISIDSDFDNVGTMQLTVTSSDTSTNSTSVTADVEVLAEISSYSFDLESGWNLISMPILPEDTSIDAVLSGLEGDTEDNVVSVMTYDTEAGEWVTYEPGAPVDGLSTIEDGKGYWIKMETGATLTVTGSTLPSGEGGIIPSAYQLDAGWNLVGFTSISSENVDTYFDTVEATVSSMIVMYHDTDLGRLRRIATSADLTPGEGYWVWVDQSAELIPY